MKPRAGPRPGEERWTNGRRTGRTPRHLLRAMVPLAPPLPGRGRGDRLEEADPGGAGVDRVLDGPGGARPALPPDGARHLDDGPRRRAPRADGQGPRPRGMAIDVGLATDRARPIRGRPLRRA